MEAEIKITQGDTTPPLQSTLTENGQPKDLTSAESVVFEMIQYVGDVTVSGEASIVNANDGVVAYHWTDGDTDAPGLYICEWTVTYTDGSQQSFPSNGVDHLYIRDDI